MRKLDLGGARPRYEPPRIAGLGALDEAAGACQTGGAATGHCSSGGQNTTGNDCKTGSVNSGSGGCLPGGANSGTQGCQAGSTAGGACVAGSYPV